MNLTSTFLSIKIIGAAVTGVYLFEHPRAWAGEFPVSPNPIVELVDADFEIAE